MHIEPGVVEGSKIVLSYTTAAGAFGYAAKLVKESGEREEWGALLMRSFIATLCVLAFFERFPTQPVGVSEVHLILGSTLLLTLGAGPTAIGLAAGLLLQGLFFKPADLPQYGMNVTTLLVPLFAIHTLAARVIPRHTHYVDIGYAQALRLSVTYQAGIVAWVAFWAFYGQGFGSENLLQVATFGAAYLSVVLVEPLIDLAVLWTAKKGQKLLETSGWVTDRLYRSA